ADRNRSHWSTSKTPSYTKSVSWQHHPDFRIAKCLYRYSAELEMILNAMHNDRIAMPLIICHV
ncbi:hypothetical protein ACNDSU_24515, partial [Enterobacter hormaechei]